MTLYDPDGVEMASSDRRIAHQAQQNGNYVIRVTSADGESTPISCGHQASVVLIWPSIPWRSAEWLQVPVLIYACEACFQIDAVIMHETSLSATSCRR